MVLVNILNKTNFSKIKNIKRRVSRQLANVGRHSVGAGIFHVNLEFDTMPIVRKL